MPPGVYRKIKRFIAKKKARVIRTVPVTMEELLTKPIYFQAGAKKAQQNKSSSFAFKNKYRMHDSFLSRYKGKIKVFADIGCALNQGAPATQASKKALGAGSKVYAVDIFPLPKGHKPVNFIPVIHSIVKGKLPQQCDAIRMANLSNHLTPEENRAALIHVHASLREGGFLLGARLDDQFILQKRGAGFRIVARF